MVIGNGKKKMFLILLITNTAVDILIPSRNTS